METLKKLLIQNAETDAQRAAQLKDYRLLAVRGYTLEIPGVAGDSKTIQKTYKIREIEGTSDAINGPEHERLIDNARLYAEKYNKKMIEEIALSKE